MERCIVGGCPYEGVERVAMLLARFEDGHDDPQPVSAYGRLCIRHVDAFRLVSPIAALEAPFIASATL